MKRVLKRPVAVPALFTPTFGRCGILVGDVSILESYEQDEDFPRVAYSSLREPRWPPLLGS